MKEKQRRRGLGNATLIYLELKVCRVVLRMVKRFFYGVVY